VKKLRVLLFYPIRKPLLCQNCS